MSSVKISDLPDMNDSSVELSVQLETGTGKRIGDGEGRGGVELSVQLETGTGKWGSKDYVYEIFSFLTLIFFKTFFNIYETDEKRKWKEDEGRVRKKKEVRKRDRRGRKRKRKVKKAGW